MAVRVHSYVFLLYRFNIARTCVSEGIDLRPKIQQIHLLTHIHSLPVEEGRTPTFLACSFNAFFLSRVRARQSGESFVKSADAASPSPEEWLRAIDIRFSWYRHPGTCPPALGARSRVTSRERERARAWEGERVNGREWERERARGAGEGARSALARWYDRWLCVGVILHECENYTVPAPISRKLRARRWTVV